MLLDIRLDGSDHGTVNMTQYGSRVGSEAVGRFLATHTTAKIVVIVDTHCLEETGYFVWKGTQPNNYEICTMKLVSTRTSHVPHPVSPTGSCLRTASPLEYTNISHQATNGSTIIRVSS